MSRVQRDRVLYFDIETHDADLMYDMSPEEFFRLGQYAWGSDGEVHLTTDLEELRQLILYAERVVGHNIIMFDLPAIFGADSLEPVHMAYQKKVVDTFVFANLVHPAPYSYTNRKGHTYYDATKPSMIMQWLSLDNQAFQLGVEGKIADLKDLAKEHGGFGNIPLDDPLFLEYAVQDVVTLQQVAQGLLSKGRVTEYVWREFFLWTINARISANGFKVDIPVAEDRVAVLSQKKEEILSWLQENYDFPTEGKSPWASSAGKEAIMNALADYGITPETHPDWERTATGNISLGGQELIRLTEGTEAEDLGKALAELKGQRSLAQLALDNVKSDGKVHPQILSLQRSGRSSVLNPGLTVWNARGPKAVEKEYFIAEEGHKLLAYDYSNADARVVAAYSGDKEYTKRFEEGVDSHELTGRLVFGDEVYESDPPHYRNIAKACIAEGQEVLTDRGLVPIESVTTDMKVWDGVEWVTHTGVIYKGIKEVIYYDGLEATEDHRVYINEANMEISFGEAAKSGSHLTQTGVGRREVRIVEEGVYERRHNGTCERSGENEREPLLTGTRKTRVYDIGNAGPRNRYTVSGKLVHNCTHAYSYKGGPKTISKTAGVSLEIAQQFVEAMDSTYKDVTAWQNRVIREGESGWVTNDWGRRMPIDSYFDKRRGRMVSRAYTQAPALYGQSGTTEIMRDALIRIYRHNPEWLYWIKVPVHDELIWSIPEDMLESAVPKIAELMSTSWGPEGYGQVVDFPVSYGEPADNWFLATH